MGFLTGRSSNPYLFLLGGLSLGDDLVEGGGVVVAIKISEGAEVADVVGCWRATGKTGPVEGFIVNHLSGAHTAGDPAVVLIGLIYHLRESVTLRTTNWNWRLCIWVDLRLDVLRVTVLIHSKFEFL